MQSSHWLHSSLKRAGLTSSSGQDVPLNTDSLCSRVNRSQAPQQHLSCQLSFLLSLRCHGCLLCVPQPHRLSRSFFSLMSVRIGLFPGVQHMMPGHRLLWSSPQRVWCASTWPLMPLPSSACELSWLSPGVWCLRSYFQVCALCWRNKISLKEQKLPALPVFSPVTRAVTKVDEEITAAPNCTSQKTLHVKTVLVIPLPAQTQLHHWNRTLLEY